MLRSLIAAPAVWSIIWPMLLIIGGYVAWSRWGAEYMAQKFYGVDPSLIEITEPPTYVRSNVVRTVYENTAMESLSLMDMQATAKIASAFASHPWVREVNSVRKLPGGTIDVRLDYRTPVAMVHVISRHPEVEGSSFFAVDGEGILLPTAEFSKWETRNYIHIEIPAAYPTGVIGSPFGDQRVEVASRLAAVLNPHRERTGLRSITVRGDWREATMPQLEINTLDGKRLFWGSPPGFELPGEPTAEMKLQSLLSGNVSDNADLRMARMPE